MDSQEDGTQSLIPVVVVMHLLRAVQHGQSKERAKQQIAQGESGK